MGFRVENTLRDVESGPFRTNRFVEINARGSCGMSVEGIGVHRKPARHPSVIPSAASDINMDGYAGSFSCVSILKMSIDIAVGYLTWSSRAR